jgi:hypothetical protein
MAEERVIKILVEDGQVVQATKDIEKLGHSIEGVEKTSKRTGKEVNSNFNDAGKSVRNLNNGIEGGVKEFKNLAGAAKVGGAAMRTALIATGIGAFVVALGLIVSNWDAIGEALGFINKDLEHQKNLLKDNNDLLDIKLERLSLQKDILKLQGKSTEDIVKQEKELLELKRLNIVDSINLLKIAIATEETKARELKWWQQIFGIPKSSGSINEEERQSLADQNEELEKKYNLLLRIEKQVLTPEKKEKEDKEKEVAKTRPNEREKAFSVDAGIEQGISDAYNEQKAKDALRLQALTEGTEEFAIIENQRIDLEVAGLVKSAEIINAKTQLEKDAEAERLELKKRNSEAVIAIDEAEFQAKQILLDGISGSLHAASDLVGRNTAAGKTFAVASALIDTYAAIAGQLRAATKSPGAVIPGYVIAQAVATGLAGFAAVKNILKVKVPGGGGGGGQSGDFSGGSSAPAAPSFNVVGTSGVNQLAQSIQGQQQPIEAYVVGANVTSQQALDRNITETASIF